MTTKKPKKKVIDGVVRKSQKPASRASETTSGTASKTTSEIRSHEDIASAITVSTDDTSVTVIEADDMEAPTSEKAPDDQPAEEIVINRNVGSTNSTLSAEPPLDNISDAILEEEVIDKNLDSLINDIEGEAEDAEEDIEEKIADIEKQEEEPMPSSATRNHKTNHEAKQNKKSTKPSQVTAKPFRIITRILAILTAAAATALAVRIATTGIVPNKYLIPGIAIVAIILLFYLFKAFRNKTRIPVLVVLDLIGIALAGASVFGFLKIDETMAFLNGNFDANKEYSIYNVIVNKKSSYSSLNDIKGKTAYSISDFVDTEKLESAAKDQADLSVAYADGITSLLQNTLDSNTYIALLNSGTYSSATDGDNDKSKTYTENLKVIGEIKVESEKSKDTASNTNLTDQSFTVYISGIDTRSGLMLDRSLSDVNIVLTVNPKTKNILMSTIPRDYYVQLHGTTGLPDKLTHAGSLGGVQLSMATIGDLLGIDFDRYIRVNFNFVVNLVNAIGGITVYSDVDYTFTSLHPEDRSCTFHPGNNAVNGSCALGFARERYAYSDGDRHRGRNQEQVIEKIFEKVTSSSTLVSKYSDILNALAGSFDTNISTSDITSFANMQLSDMAKWTVNTYNLDGTGGNAYTYSYPSQYLYVMYPDQTTVDTAKQKIQEVLTGATSASTAK